jgi:hypothetical protein
MIKVINLVSLLIAPVIITLRTQSQVIAYVAGGVSLVFVVWAIWRSKSERYQLAQTFDEKDLVKNAEKGIESNPGTNPDTKDKK